MPTEIGGVILNNVVAQNSEKGNLATPRKQENITVIVAYTKAMGFVQQWKGQKIWQPHLEMT